MFERVLVANRGEIAVRILRTLHRLGISSVAVHSDADAEAPHVRLAHHAVRIGPPPATESYLRIDRIVEAALATGAQALHPGYGFLAENAALADACAANGIVFVGPPAAAIDAMGDKIRAKQTVAAAGVRTVPGSEGAGMSDDALCAAALAVGLPVLIKPSAGGGGKGMKLVRAESELIDAIASARREARNAFGNDDLLVERFVERPRHVEIQVLADSHGTVLHLGERECSLQRRHQKIVEEAPSPLLDDARREAMGAQAVAAARACGYVNAGTVEFIVSGTNPDDAFFMEMNTRLQVEHPVTEMVWGVDLVELQLRIAAGERLPFTQDDLTPNGHAVEARVYAEDPRHEFVPTGGRVLFAGEPIGAGVRVDSGIEVGTEIGGWYDPMLAKVIAWAPDRASALHRLDQALAQSTILGVTTNIAFLRRLIAHPDVVAGDFDTGLVERALDALIEHEPPSDLAIAAGVADVLPRGSVHDPWASRTGWRVGDDVPLADVDVHWTGDDLRVGERIVHVRREGHVLWVGVDGDAWAFPDREPRPPDAPRRGAGSGVVGSPMPGTVVAVLANVGERVEHGRPLVVVEAMKMEHTIRAPVDGVVAELPVAVGQKVALGQTVVVIEEVQ